MKKLFLVVIAFTMLNAFQNKVSAQIQAPGLDILGFGYDVFGDYADQSSKKRYCLFIYSDFTNVPIGSNQYSVPQYVFLENISKHKVSTISGKSMREYSKSQSSSVGLSTNAMFFSASINSSFSQSSSSTERHYYYTYRDANTKWRISFDERDFENLNKILDPRFKQDLATMKPAELFERYGTHYIASAYLGGRADYNTKTVITGSTNTSEIAVAVEASYGAITGSASTSQNSSSKKLNSKTTSKLTVTGGNSEYANNISNSESYHNWASGIATMPVLCDFDKNSLKPIWDFCTTEKRKTELKAEFANILKTHPLPAALSGTTTVKDKVFFISNVAESNLYIDVPGYHFDANKNNGTQISMYEKDNVEPGKQGIDRFIKVIPHSNGEDYVFLQPQHSERVFDLPGGSKEPGTKVQLWDMYNDNAAQMFKLLEVDGKTHTYYIKNKSSGLYLTSNGKNNQITQEAVTKAENQQWVFKTAQAANMASVPVNRAFSIMNVEAKRYMDLAGNGQNAKTKDGQIKLWEKGDNPDRYSKLLKSSLNDYFYVQQMHSKYVWDIEGGKKSNGAKLQLWDKINKPQQQFKFIYAGSPMTFKIQNRNSNTLIDASSTRIDQNGCPIQLWEDNGQDNQKWKLEMLPEWYAPNQIKVKIQAAYSSKTWDLAGGAEKANMNGSKLQIWTDADDADRHYVIKSSGDNAWIWIELDGNGGKRITVDGEKVSTNGAHLITWEKTASNAQKFAIHPTGRYTCIIVTPGWKALGMERSEINTNGTSIILWNMIYNGSQQFKLIDVTTGQPVDFSK